MSITLLPIPALVLHNVRIGTLPLATVDTLRAHIDLRTLRDPVTVLPHIDLDGLTLRQEALKKIPLWFQPGNQATIDIKMVRLYHSYLVIKKRTLGPVNAEIHLSPQGDLNNATITSLDRALSIAVKPESKQRYRIAVKARQWQPPYGPRLRFDELNASLLANAGNLDVLAIKGKLYQGSFSGQGKLSWGNIWNLRGTLTSKAVQVQPLLSLLTDQVSATGRMDSSANYSARAYASESLMRTLKLDGTFNILQGTLYNVDLAEAARGSAQKDVRGGHTRFDEFSGALHLENEEYRFKNMRVTSSLLNGSGKVNIAADKTVSGQVNVALKGSAGLINAPLEVVGTLDNPVLRLRRSALAGAVAGTMVLGPGLGTTIGIKASEMLDKLGDIFMGDSSTQPTETARQNEPEKKP